MTSVHSDIFDVWVCNPPDPFSFFYSFDLFQSAWLVLVRMASPNGGDSDFPNEVCGITKFRHHILRKGCSSRNAFIRKEKFWAQISRKVKPLKALKETVKCVYGPSLECGNEQSFSFTDKWAKENKRVNRLQKETLELFVLTYLLPIEFFFDILCDIYF